MKEQQQRLWPEEPQYGPIEEPTPEECDTLHALCVLATNGELGQLIGEMVDAGYCDNEEEWLMSVLEVMA